MSWLRELTHNLEYSEEGGELHSSASDAYWLRNLRYWPPALPAVFHLFEGAHLWIYHNAAVFHRWLRQTVLSPTWIRTGGNFVRDQEDLAFTGAGENPRLAIHPLTRRIAILMLWVYLTVPAATNTAILSAIRPVSLTAWITSSIALNVSSSALKAY